MGIAVLYKEHIEANIIIPGLPQYNEDVSFMVISETNVRRGYLYK